MRKTLQSSSWTDLMILCNKGHSGHRLQSRRSDLNDKYLRWAASRLLDRDEIAAEFEQVFLQQEILTAAMGLINTDFISNLRRGYYRRIISLTSVRKFVTRIRRWDLNFALRLARALSLLVTLRNISMELLCSTYGLQHWSVSDRAYVLETFQLFAHFMRIHKSSFNRILPVKVWSQAIVINIF